VADFHQPPLEIVDRVEVKARLSHYPDQSLVSHLLLGARTDADVELQFVLVPHLTTLPFGFKSVMSEVDRLEGYGWYRSFGAIPFAPMYLNGQGATARKLEPDRWRRTTEGGGPRQATFDAGGIRALSLNEAARIYHMPEHFVSDHRESFLEWLRRRGLPRDDPIPPSDGRRRPTKWPPEVKPTLENVMRDMAVLGRAASRWQTALYCSNDDIKDYFNHLAVATSELSKVGILLDRADGSGPRFVSERVLGFGLHGSSNLAQRFSDSLVILYYEDMDAEYFASGAVYSAAELAWLEHRLALQRREGEPCVDIRQWTAPPSERLPAIPAPARLRDIPPGYVCPQLRPYRCFFFTDDAQMFAVGPKLKIMSLRNWRRLTNRMRLRMAIAEKRSLGTWCKWIGVLLIPILGLVVVTRDKILRASAAIGEALADRLEFHAYRALCGLLEHLRSVNLRGRNIMHGLYRPHGPDGASREGPSGIVRCDALMRGQLKRWQYILTDSCGVSVKRALLRENLETLPSVSLELFSDACYADVATPGVGGYLHGLYWYFPVPAPDVPYLSIPILEFLGAAFNVLMFYPHLHQLGSASAPAWVDLYTDALTTARVLAAESARSPVIVEAYQHLIASPEWRSLYGRLRVAHLYGDANILADLISRARWAEFRQLCAMLGVRPQLLEISTGVLELYRVVVRYLRERSHLAATARGVFNPHLIGDQPIAQDAASSAADRSAELAALLHSRLRPAPSAGLAELSPTDLLRPTAAPPATGFCAGVFHRALSPRPPTPAPAVPSPSLLSAASAGHKDSAEPSFQCTPMRASLGKRRLHDPGPSRHVGGLRMPPAPPWAEAQSSSLAAASSEYARLRALALAEGGEPSMAIRAELSDAMAVTAVIDETVFFGINANTLGMDVRAWDMWERVCRSQGTSPLRTAAEARDFPERNAHLLACLLLHAFAVGRPRDRSRAFIKPRSALAYPLAIVRVFARWGVTMPSYKVLKAAVAGLSRAYLSYYGPYSLAPKRAEPMKFSMVRELYAIPSAESSAAQVGGLRWRDSDHNVFMFRRLICVMMVTAFRLGEVVKHASNEIMFLTFESLTWVIGGIAISHPTPAQLAAMRPGVDGARLAPPRSKPDQTGEIHCPFSVVLTYHPDDPINAAAALRDIELRVGRSVTSRSTTPLFADAAGEPYSHHFLHALLRAALAHLYGKAVAELYSFHSFRSGLASALHAAGVEDGMIQLICRWMCPESLHVYRRMGVAEHEALIRRASGCHVDCTQSVNVPTVVGDQHMAALTAEFSQLKAAAEVQAYEHAVRAAMDPFSPQEPLRRDRPAALAAARMVPPDAPEPPAEPLVTLEPIGETPTAGAELAVCRTMWPSYPCDELGGQGWRVLVLSATPTTSTIRFTHARHRGRRYEDIQVQTSSLMLIKPLDTLDQQGP
jgi:integrase